MADYFTEIEGHFALRRGTPFVVSAKDWALMKKWHEEGVPLPIVLEAIDSVFENNETSGRRKTISSLSYCRHAVKELWAERRELTVGDGTAAPEESPAAPLEALAAELEAVPNDVARRFATRVRELASEKTIPRIEECLMETERELIEALTASLPDEDRQEIRRELARVIGDPAKLDEKTRARTEEANLRRIVRERFSLPRLTLFR